MAKIIKTPVKIFKVSRDKDTSRSKRDKDFDPDDDRYDEDRKRTSSTKKVTIIKKKKYDDSELSFEKEKPEILVDESKKKKSGKALRKLSNEKNKFTQAEQSASSLLNKVRRDLKENEPKDDNDFRVVYLDMFEKQRQIIKRTEERLLSDEKNKDKAGGREIYQLAQMYSQLRETIADLRSISDLSDHAERIIDLCMRPLFTDIVQKMSNTMYALKIKIRDKIKDRMVSEVSDITDDMTVEFGKELQIQYDKMSQKIRDMMVETK